MPALPTTDFPTSMPTWTDGPAGAPAVVFLHGATADNRSWGPQVRALRDRFRTVTVDLRGHGSSPEVGAFDFDATVTDVVDLLGGVDRPVALVGLSLGGAVAQEVVRRAPDAVDALVVADATCITAPRALIEKPLATAALSGMALLPQEVFHRRAARALTNDPDVCDGLEADLQEWTSAAAVQVLIELVAALHPDPDYRLPVPALLLHGAEDRIGDIARSTRDWADRDPRAEYVVVPDAGHVSNLDNPEAFTAALRTFLDRTLPRTVDTARRPSGRPVARARPSFGRRWARRVLRGSRVPSRRTRADPSGRAAST